MIEFYPAIDIKSGKVIRLKKGLLEHETVYGTDPIIQAKKFVELGAKWIHVVDIDGAFKGETKNIDTIIEIKKRSACKIQVGGGIRNLNTIERYLNNGIDRLVLGTIALNRPEFVKNLCQRYPEKIAIGLDTKKGFVATEGWAKESKVNFKEILKIYEKSSVSAIIFTDIDKDGLMKGANYKQLKELLSLTKIKIIASGGIASLEDLKIIKKLETPNLIGVISGKALYEKKFNVSEAIDILEKQIA